MIKTKTSKGGFAALSSILILSAIAVVISLSVTIISIGTSQNSLAMNKSLQARYLAESCAEDVLFRIRADANYTTTSITLPTGVCTVTVSKAGSNYTITSTSQGQYSRTVSVSATRASQLTITAWTVQ